MYKPDMIISAIHMRIFCRKLGDGRVIAPTFMFDAMNYWCNCPPKFVYGSKKIISELPLECDASINYHENVISMREMAQNLLLIPMDTLMYRREFFHMTWENISLFTDGIRHQAGLSLAEVDHLQRGFGPGPWEREVLIKEEN